MIILSLQKLIHFPPRLMQDNKLVLVIIKTKYPTIMLPCNFSLQQATLMVMVKDLRCRLETLTVVSVKLWMTVLKRATIRVSSDGHSNGGNTVRHYVKLKK